MWTIILLVLAALVLVAAIVWRYRPMRLFVRQPALKTESVVWEVLNAVPTVGRGHTPQGMTRIGDDIIFACSLSNRKSVVYRINTESMEPVQNFDMPREAVHTSGLAFDGQCLWAVDYVANQCYELDSDASFASGKAVVIRKFATGLKGTSACCFLSYHGDKLLAVSDFMSSRRTYLVRHHEAAETGCMQDAVVFSYENEGFSQGLAWDGAYLYESENKFGCDIVNKLDLASLASTGKARASTLAQFNGPSRGIEDMVFLGPFLYTSDETTFKFYRCQLE